MRRVIFVLLAMGCASPQRAPPRPTLVDLDAALARDASLANDGMSEDAARPLDAAPSEIATIRIVHASPAPSLVHVQIVGAASAVDLTYRSMAFIAVPFEARSGFEIRSVGGDVVARGVAGVGARVLLGMPPERWTLLDVPPTDAGLGQIAFVHALSGVGSLDVCDASQGTIASRVEYASAATGRRSAGESVVFRHASTPACRGVVVGLAAVPSTARDLWIATGNAGRPAVAWVLLGCDGHDCDLRGLTAH